MILLTEISCLKIMKKRMGVNILILVGIAFLIGIESPRTVWAQSNELPIDTLLQISSVANTPLWFPDGSQIIFSSSYNRGRLMSISPNSGFPIRLPVNLGQTEHFLTRQGQRISPDGKWISYVSTKTKSGLPDLWLWSVVDGREIQLTNLGGRINATNWSPDSKWIAFSGDRYGNFDIWKVAVPSGEVHRLTSDKRYEIYPSWTPDSKKILYVRLDEKWIDHDVIEITETGQSPRVVVSDTDLFDYGYGRTFQYAPVSADGKMVLFRSRRSGWINYWVVPLAGGEPKQIAPAEADQSQALWSPDGKSIVYIENHNGTLELRVVSATGGQPRVLVAPQIGICDNPAWSPDGTRICYTFSTPTTPVDLFVISVNSGKVKQLTYSMLALAGNVEKALVMPDKISYKSSDGFTIPAYLYKPPTIKPGERFPGVMWIHGGPTSQFRDTLQLNVQFFVQRGYVLLLPNIRGSSGYGNKFEDANNKCWGECDLKDVLAGVEYLKTLPYVDPNNIGITGTSYGGMMTTAAVGRAPGVFQAAIACSGESDWVLGYKIDEMRHVKLWDYEFGPLKGNEELYERLNPINYVEKITTPTFVLHGEGRWPESPLSKIFATELQRHYKVFKYKAYQGENYYVRGLENRRQMLLDMLDFFDQFLKVKIVNH